MTKAFSIAATSIIRAHNHPSGQLKPSKADELLTNKNKQGTQLMDIQMSDHFILSSIDGYYPVADEGLI